MADWRPTLEFDFSQQSVLDEWIIEGAAEISLTDQGEFLVENVSRKINGQDVVRSTVWYREPIWGDVKFEMEMKGEPKNGNIWFFNARALKGHKSIFEWERPQANYVDYTGEARMEMHTLGILRSHQEEINFRYLGGTLSHLVDRSKADTTKSADPDHQGMSAPDFQEKTISHAAPSPFSDFAKFYKIELSTTGSRIQLRVDGADVMDYIDETRAADPLRGGYFAFRNFAKTRTWCRSLRVLQRE